MQNNGGKWQIRRNKMVEGGSEYLEGAKNDGKWQIRGNKIVESGSYGVIFFGKWEYGKTL